MSTTRIPQQRCIKCNERMEPLFTLAEPNYLRGWLCKCGVFEKAILRERKFTIATAKAKDNGAA